MTPRARARGTNPPSKTHLSLFPSPPPRGTLQERTYSQPEGGGCKFGWGLELAVALELRIRLHLTGVKIPKIGKRGCRSQKTPFPTTPEKGVPGQKIHFPCSALYRDFLTQNALFWGGGKGGFFDSETLFSRFWGF